MSHQRLALLGFGNVGGALAHLLLRKESELREKYDITFSVTGIATGKHGAAVNPDGLNLQNAITTIEADQCLSTLSQTRVVDSFEFLHVVEADVLFENTPVDHATGQPAIDHTRLALERGMHVCTANKGAVVFKYRELKELSLKMGKKFFFESSVMDGAPIFSMFRETLPAVQLKSFRGILNSTTNIILTRMEQGQSFEEALAYCRKAGITETDASADLDGWDAAIKVAALVTVLMDVPLTPRQVERRGIREITSKMVARAKAQDKRYKLICSAERVGEDVNASVAPALVPRSSTLYYVEGSTSIVEFTTDVLGSLSILETDPGPHTTAYGLLADFINAVRQ